MWKFHAALPYNVVCYNKYKELQKAALLCNLFFVPVLFQKHNYDDI